MDWRQYFSTLKGALLENKIWRIIVLGLVASNLVLSIMALGNRETFVPLPANLTKEVRVGLNVGDRAYKETWGLFFAMLLGNVTPKTIDFVLERTGKYLSPNIYQDTLKDMYAQAKQLKTNNLTISYEPVEVDFDEKTGRVLVKGIALMRGSYGAPQALQRTYELGIEVRDYQPILSYLSAYERKEEVEGGKEQKDQKNKPFSGAAGGPARSRK
jgi:conjugal transfer pilus assembly protein TraE